MKKVSLVIVGLSYSHTPSGSYTIILSDPEHIRTLPIIIGSFEAQAIAMELGKIVPHRPLTHDLFRNFADTFDISVREIFIFNLENGIFYSQIICHKNGQDYFIDARTSDAIAIGIRCRAPIFISEDILESAAVELDQDVDFSSQQNNEKQESGSIIEAYQNSSIYELQQKLQEAIEKEEYELASIIRDEIKKRNID